MTLRSRFVLWIRALVTALLALEAFPPAIFAGEPAPSAQDHRPSVPPATPADTAGERGARDLKDALPPEKWNEVEASVDRALAWLATQQRPDGSFHAPATAQPAATGFATLAFLSRGHHPGTGPYGRHLEKAIDFVLACQQPDGLLSQDAPRAPFQLYMPPHTASYNHAIGGLMLGEAYGQISGERAKAVKQAIENALKFTRNLRDRPPPREDQVGGWGYVVPGPLGPVTDLSVTGWQIMFLRSAKNAEFEIPEEMMTEAVEFVRRCFEPRAGNFLYRPLESPTARNDSTRGLAGIGILSLSMAGEHQTPMALAAGDWLVAHPFRTFGESVGHTSDRFYYSIHACSQAAVQLGGEHWEKIYPPVVNVLLDNQRADGSWPPEPKASDFRFGNAITTAMAVLSLTPPYQLLPVYQR